MPKRLLVLLWLACLALPACNMEPLTTHVAGLEQHVQLIHEDLAANPATTQRGEPGLPGKDGVAGPQGVAGTNGQNGKDGKDGTDGKAGKDGCDVQTGSPVNIDLSSVTANTGRIADEIKSLHKYLKSTQPSALESGITKVASVITWLLNSAQSGLDIKEKLEKFAPDGVGIGKTVLSIMDKVAGFLKGSGGDAKTYSQADVARALQQLYSQTDNNVQNDIRNDIKIVWPTLTGTPYTQAVAASMVVNVAPSSVNIPQPFVVSVEKPAQVHVKIDKDETSLVHALDENALVILAAVLGIAAYLRAQSGNVAKSKHKLIAQYAWYRQILKHKLNGPDPDATYSAACTPFTKSDAEGYKARIEKTLKERRCWYRLLVFAEALAIVLAGMLGVYVVCPNWVLARFIGIWIAVTFILLVIVHVLLWGRAGFCQSWTCDDADAGKIIPQPPGA